MKKVYDWNINLKIRVSDLNEAISLHCSVHTTIHLLKIEICKCLKLPLLDTDIILSANNIDPLKATSTLLQNQITKDALLTATIKSQKVILQTKQKAGKEASQTIGNGLSLICECRNKNCVNFMQEVKVNLGFGKFDLEEIMQNVTCQICPYKSQHLQLKLKCKQMYVKNCIYRTTTVIHDAEAIFNEKHTNWTKVSAQKKLFSMTHKVQENQVGVIVDVRKL